MKVGNFELTIAGKREESTGHVALDHGEQYSIVMENYYTDRRATALVKIDGEEIDSFRLEAGDVLKLERKPGDDKGRFTFYAVDSREGKIVGGEKGVDTNGLIEVMFTPEKYRDQVRTYSKNTDHWKEPRPIQPFGGTLRRDSMTKGSVRSRVEPLSATYCSSSVPLSAASLESPRGLSEGVTGLSGHSSQSFRYVAPLDLDHSKAVTITLRLGVKNNDPRPLSGKRNRVPEPLG